jgi:hypothetical protein
VVDWFQSFETRLLIMLHANGGSADELGSISVENKPTGHGEEPLRRFNYVSPGLFRGEGGRVWCCACLGAGEGAQQRRIRARKSFVEGSQTSTPAAPRQLATSPVVAHAYLDQLTRSHGIPAARAASGPTCSAAPN